VLARTASRWSSFAAMSALTLHRATPDDAAMYARVARETFYDSYSAMSDPAMMTVHLHRHFSPAIQRAELEDAANTVLVAREGADWVGFAALRRCEAPACVTGDSPLQLQRLYAVRSWHGRGAGKFLLDAVLDEARERGHDMLWLQVWERNARARRFYGKHGFEAVGTHPYQFADEWEDDIVLQRSTGRRPGRAEG
jgi:GNAT superfamily N-acetyltransferase